MNQLIIKQTAILSAILGGIIGILTLIPFVNGFAFMALILVVGAIVLVYMKKKDLIGIFDVKEGAILGGIIGFTSFIAFSVVFIPSVMIINLILGLFKISYYTYGIKALLQMSGFFILFILIFFLAFLSALMNAFAGLVTAYVYEALTGIKKEEKEANEGIDFEIKD